MPLGEDGVEIVPGSLNIHWTDDASEEDIAALHAAFGATPGRFRRSSRTQSVQVDPADHETALAAYRASGLTLDAYEDRVLEVDPSYSDPTDTYYVSNGAHLATYGVRTAWDVTRGDSDVTVGVIDTGFISHVDITGSKVLSNRANGYTGTPTTHGVGVLSLMAADHNGAGLAGVAPDCTYRFERAFNSSQTGFTDAIFMDILDQLTDDGVSVINMSLGALTFMRTDVQAVITAAWNSGIVLVAAAGNNNYPAADYPANGVNVVAVANINDNGTKYSTSSYGTDVDMAAPGVTKWQAQSTNTYRTASGSSFSSPLVAAVVALLRSVNPSWTPTQTVNRLYATCVKDAGIAAGYWSQGLLDAAAAFRPDAIATPTATAGKLMASVAWTALSLTASTPQSGSPITSHDLEVIDVTAASITTITGAGASPVAVPSLIAEHVYTFRVRAINIAGAGAWSPLSNSVTVAAALEGPPLITDTFNKFRLRQHNGSPINFTSDTLKILLTNASYTPNKDTHEFVSDVTNELSGGGYVRKTLASGTVTLNTTTDKIEIDAADITWTALTGTVRRGVLFKDSGSDATSALVGWVDNESDVPSLGGDFVLTVNASGLLNIA